MLPIPSRAALAALTGAANAVAPSPVIGFARCLDEAHVSFLYSDAHGIGELVVSADEAPDALRPRSEGIRQADAETIMATADRPIEWHLQMNGVQRVVSVPLAGLEPATRFLIGAADSGPLTAEQIRRIEAVAQESAGVLTAAPSSTTRATSEV